MDLILYILLVAMIVIIIIIFILLFTVDLKVKVVFDTCKTGLNMTLLWLHSVLKALVTIEDTKPVLTLYLFNKKLFKRKVKTGSGKFSSMEYIKSIESRDIHVNAYYGFRDPCTTGITCGAINVATQFINIDYINQQPDFTTENDYIYLDANANVNLGSTIVKFLKLKH